MFKMLTQVYGFNEKIASDDELKPCEICIKTKPLVKKHINVYQLLESQSTRLIAKTKEFSPTI